MTIQFPSLYQDGVKPICLMIEDFDEYGNVKSSVPVQFLAVVWTPDESYMFDNARHLGLQGQVEPYLFPSFFMEELHDDRHEHPSLEKYRKPFTTAKPVTNPRPLIGLLGRYTNFIDIFPRFNFPYLLLQCR